MTNRAAVGLVCAGVAFCADAALLLGQFEPELTPSVGVGVNNGMLVVNGDQYPLPPLLDPPTNTTIRALPSARLLLSQRPPRVNDTCSGSATQTMFHRLPSSAGQVLEAVRTVCGNEPRAFEGIYDSPQRSRQIVAALREVRSSTSDEQRVQFVRLDTTPGVVASQFFQASVESIQFSPSGTVALVKHDLPGGTSDPADWSFVDLCPATFGQRLGNFPDLGAGGSAQVEDDGAAGYRIRFHHPQLLNGATTFPIVDCLNAPPPPPPGEERLVVQIVGSGGGSIRSVDGGVNCPGDCTESYASGTNVALEATPNIGSRFVEWRDDCSGTDVEAAVTMDRARTCTAEFESLQPDLVVDCAPGAATVTAGAELAITIGIENVGNADASFVTAAWSATDFLFSPVSAPTSCFAVDDGVECNLGTIAAGERRVIDLPLVVDPFARGHAEGVATATAFNGEPDIVDNDCGVSVPVTTQVDLAVDKSVIPEQAAPGELVAYSIRVSNTGLSAATSVDLQDTLPTGLTALPGFGPGDCALDAVAPRSDVGASIVAQLSSSAIVGSSITNVAGVSSAETDLDPSNNSDSARLDVVARTPATGPQRFQRIYLPQSFGAEISPPAQSGDVTTFVHNATLYRAFSGVVAPVISTGQSVSNRAGGLVNYGFQFTPVTDGLTVYYSGQYVDSGPPYRQTFPLIRSSGCRSEALYDPPSPLGLAVRGDTVIIATGAELVRYVADTPTTLVDSTTELPGTDLPPSWIRAVAFDGDQMAFAAGAGFGRCNVTYGECAHEGIYALSPTGSGLRRLVDSSTPIPGKPGTFGGFINVDGAIDLDHGFLTFYGRDADGEYGLYRYGLDDGSLHLVVDGQTMIPGTSVPFNDIGTRFNTLSPALHHVFNPAAVSGGAVVFWAAHQQPGGRYEPGTAGFYLWQDGDISAILTEGDLLEGEAVESLFMHSRSLSGNRLAFVAENGFGNALREGVWTLRVGIDTVFSSSFE